MVGFIGTYILRAFFDIPVFRILLAAVTFLFCCLNFRALKPLTRNMAISLLVLSGVFIWFDAQPFEWTQAIIENAGLVTMLITSPLLGSILCFAPYDKALLAFADRRIHTNYVFYVMTVCLTAFLGILMNLATIPFMYQLMTPLLQRFSPDVFHRALFRGYAVNLFWAPNMVCVAVVLQYVAIPWNALAPIGLIFSAVSLLAACSVEKYTNSPEPMPITRQTLNGEKRENVTAKIGVGRYLLLLLAQLALIVSVLLTLTGYVGKNIYVSLAIVAIIIPFALALLFKKMAVYRQQLARYIQETLPRLGNEFIQFTCIGFFGYSFSKSAAVHFVQAQLASINNYNAGIVVFLIIVVIGGLALLGIHPIISISSIAIAFANIDSGISDVQLAIALLTGYIMYLFLSPFSSMVMIMSGLTKKNVYEMGFRLNWQYASILAVAITAMIDIWRRLGY